MQRVRGISSSQVTVAIGTYQLDRRNQKIQKTRSTLPRAIVGELLCPLQVTAQWTVLYGNGGQNTSRRNINAKFRK
ncbi:hypothetical protein ACLKA7_000786 [Drosophila subpalustris]